MKETVLDKLKFVDQFNLARPRKTQADMFLLYYLGVLALRHTNSNVLEIGVGLSSYAMHELTTMFDQIFYAVDIEESRLNTFCFDNTHTKKINKPSAQLHNTEVGALGYVNIDGDKNYTNTRQDLQFAYEHLDDMGIVSVNAYGLNCWPTVMQAVNSYVADGVFEILVIGDGSVWLVKQSSYLAWLQILKTDFEFELLSACLNIHNSNALQYTPEYFFINNLFPTPAKDVVNPEMFNEYSQCLAKYSVNFNQSHDTGKL